MWGGSGRKQRLPSALPVAEASQATGKVCVSIQKVFSPSYGMSLCTQVGPLEAFEHVCGLTSYPAGKIQISNGMSGTHRRQRAQQKPHPSGPPSTIYQSLCLLESLSACDTNGQDNWSLSCVLPWLRSLGVKLFADERAGFLKAIWVFARDV